MTRRGFVAASLAGVGGLAGCVGLGGGSHPTSFEITVSGSDGLSAKVTPSGSAEGVIQIYVGDEVTFEFANELDGKVSVHNHVIGEEAVVDAGGTHTMEFAVKDDMVGRHTIEGYRPQGHSGHDHEHGNESSGGGGHQGTELVTVEVRP